MRMKPAQSWGWANGWTVGGRAETGPDLAPRDGAQLALGIRVGQVPQPGPRLAQRLGLRQRPGQARRFPSQFW